MTTATAVHRFELPYKATWTRIEGRCAVDCWQPDDIHRGLLVVTELDHNPGPSVTNAIEAIARALHGQVEGLHAYNLVEHYPPNTMRGHTFDLVEFDLDLFGNFANPRWNHLNNQALDALAPRPPAPSSYPFPR